MGRVRLQQPRCERGVEGKVTKKKEMHLSVCTRLPAKLLLCCCCCLRRGPATRGKSHQHSAHEALSW